MANGYLGAGKVSIALYSSGASFGAREFIRQGNTSKLALNFSEDVKTLKDYESASGGNADQNSRIEKVEIAMDAREFIPGNLARALWADTSVGNATPIANEAHVLNAGAFIPTARMIDTSQPVTVKQSSGSVTIDADDYVVSAGGIYVAATLTTVGATDGAACTIDYTPKASTNIEMLTQSAPEVSVFFDGTNINTGKPMLIRAHRVKLGALSSLDLITEDFGTIAVAGEVLKDTTVVGAGLSQFAQIEM